MNLNIDIAEKLNNERQERQECLVEFKQEGFLLEEIVVGVAFAAVFVVGIVVLFAK